MGLGIPKLYETIEESEISCDTCGRLIGFIKWFKDMSTPCPVCSEATPKEVVNTHKMLCVKCRIITT